MRFSIGIAIGAGLMLSAPARAQNAADCARPVPVYFGKGKTQTVVTGGMIRGESACFTIAARAGQTLSATAKSPDENVVFTIYQPGYTAKAEDGEPGFAGRTLSGAGEDGVDAVRAKLPRTGRYLIVLDTTRGGGGEFRLALGVR